MSPRLTYRSRKLALVVGALILGAIAVLLALPSPTSRLIAASVIASLAAFGFIGAIALEASKEIEDERIQASRTMDLSQWLAMTSAHWSRKSAGPRPRMEAEAKQPEAGLRLAEVDLQDAVLGDIDLRQADLRGANLKGADLRGAHLQRADLRGADLRFADLEGARFESALYDWRTRWPTAIETPSETGAVDVTEVLEAGPWT